jgi:molybdate transport system substrate-binding protein
MKILSAGAVQRGIEAVAGEFQRQAGGQISLAFATAPVIRAKIESREAAPDLVAAPRELIFEFARQRLVEPAAVSPVGDVKAGIAVGPGDWRPDISTARALEKELLACDAVLYTEGSSGVFAEEILARLAIAEALAGKTRRLTDAGAVMTFLAEHSNLHAIGFGQLTAIALHADKGVQLVGPLPPGLESITSYVAAMSAAAKERALAWQFLELLASPSAKALLRTNGID